MPAPDLIFHIGLAKCGSCTLQRDVFQYEEGYLGTAPGIAPELNLAKQLQQYTPFGGRQTINRRGLARWASRVGQLRKDRWPDLDRLILSNEFLSAACRVSDRPFLKVLSRLHEKHWSGRIRVVVVFRNQGARIASGYAQNSATNPGASQEDFERAVHGIMASRRKLRLFDYSAWIDGLQEILGPDNVLPLFLEQTGSSEFWARLTDFCGLRNLKVDEMTLSANRSKNRRSLTGERWAISAFNPSACAKRKVDKWINLMWPENLASGARRSAKDRAVRAIEVVYQSRARDAEARNRGSVIELTPQTRNLIQRHVGPFNAKFGRQLGQDLNSLGYWSKP
jgi:hypothetical protein